MAKKSTWTRRVLLVAILGTSTSSCAQVLGLGEFSEGGGGGTTTSTVTTTGGGGLGGAAPTCASGTCQPAPPPGWTLVAVQSGSVVSPTCPEGFPTELVHGVAGLTYGPASCSACTCSASTVTCVPQTLGAYANGTCSGFGTGNAQPIGTCSHLAGANLTSFSALAPTMSASCTPSGGAATLPVAPPSWAQKVLACASTPDSEGCTPSETCTPPPPAKFDLCLAHSDDIACPASHPTKTLVSSDPSALVDTRACSQCTCDGGTGSCQAKSQLYSSSNCTGTIVAIAANVNACQASPTAAQSSLVQVLTTAGTCAHHGGDPIGEVRPGGSLTTVCCGP